MPCLLGKTMGRKFKLSNNYYGEDFKMFNRINIEINKGLTVLVGCNGSGKTTFLKQINDILKNNDIPVMFHSNMRNGERELKSKAAFHGDFNIVAKLMMSSEGENIVNVMAFAIKVLLYSFGSIFFAAKSWSNFCFCSSLPCKSFPLRSCRNLP